MELFVYALLILTSVIGLTFIVERGIALRWRRVAPSEIEAAVESEPFEDLFLTPGQVPSKPGEARGHLEVLDADAWEDHGPSIQEMVGEVARHVGYLTDRLLPRNYLTCEIVGR